jgi:hypothetical protein
MSNKYLTVKEFAAAAGISQQAVYKQLGSRLKPFVENKGSQKVIAEEALKEFYPAADLPEDSTQESTDPTCESTNSTEKDQTIQPDSTDKVEQNKKVEQPDSTDPAAEKRQKELEDQIRELQEQIKEIIKNDQEEKKFLRDQLIQKDKQIESLNENLKMAQQLAAIDKKKLLELENKQPEEDPVIAEEPKPDPEPPAAEQEIEEPKKKGFWSFLSGLFS